MAITTADFVKSWLGIIDATYDTKINSLIPVVEQTYLDIRNIPWQLDNTGNIVYPANAKVVAAELIAYKIATLKDAGSIKSSESIDAYSVSWKDVEIVGGFPVSITSQIKRFMDGR